jgi:hypothetical protein
VLVSVRPPAEGAAMGRCSCTMSFVARSRRREVPVPLLRRPRATVAHHGHPWLSWRGCQGLRALLQAGCSALDRPDVPELRPSPAIWRPIRDPKPPPVTRGAAGGRERCARSYGRSPRPKVSGVDQNVHPCPPGRRNRGPATGERPGHGPRADHARLFRHMARARWRLRRPRRRRCARPGRLPQSKPAISSAASGSTTRRLATTMAFMTRPVAAVPHRPMRLVLGRRTGAVRQGNRTFARAG